MISHLQTQSSLPYNNNKKKKLNKTNKHKNRKNKTDLKFELTKEVLSTYPNHLVSAE